MDLGSLLSHGANVPDVALATSRVALGAFFSISGYHKLFNPTRHATIRATLAACGVPFVPVMCWFVPSVEFSAGLALVPGILTPLAALGLIAICLVATVTDGLKRIRDWRPIDRADYADDVLYLPEVLYLVMLLTLVLCGAGRFSIDAIVASYL